jgi:CPA1 family monovalent cation:H+ antiporter
MNVLEISTVLLLLASVFSIINLRILKLPQTIGLMVLAIMLSVCVLVTGLIVPSFLDAVTSLTQRF